MNTEITETYKGWIFYDGTCAFCRGWVDRSRGMLLKRGYHFVPLQAPWVMERLGLSAGEPLVEMKLLTIDNRVLGGADALVELASAIWWMVPFWLVAQFPGVRRILHYAYRRLAANRHCLGGRCKIRPAVPPKAGHITSSFYELP